MDKITEVVIHTVKHQHQRYDTVGDWRFIEGVLVIMVSDTGNWFYNMLIALHEFVEAILCTYRGISPQMVDSFDLKHKEYSNPGSHTGAPYHKEHMAADTIERTTAQFAEVNWNDYEISINNLPQWKELKL